MLKLDSPSTDNATRPGSEVRAKSGFKSPSSDDGAKA